MDGRDDYIIVKQQEQQGGRYRILKLIASLFNEHSRARICQVFDEKDFKESSWITD